MTFLQYKLYNKNFIFLKNNKKRNIIIKIIIISFLSHNYDKESISTTTKNIYTKVKSKAIELYYNISDRLCSNHEDLCETAKDEFQKIKNTLKLSWDLIKDIGGDGLESMKKWYESFRESY